MHLIHSNLLETYRWPILKTACRNFAWNTFKKIAVLGISRPCSRKPGLKQICLPDNESNVCWLPLDWFSIERNVIRYTNASKNIFDPEVNVIRLDICPELEVKYYDIFFHVTSLSLGQSQDCFNVFDVTFNSLWIYVLSWRWSIATYSSTLLHYHWDNHKTASMLLMQPLTHCGLVTLYGDRDLGQH